MTNDEFDKWQTGPVLNKETLMTRADAHWFLTAYPHIDTAKADQVIDRLIAAGSSFSAAAIRAAARETDAGLGRTQQEARLQLDRSAELGPTRRHTARTTTARGFSRDL
jgi:hypothetical protein